MILNPDGGDLCLGHSMDSWKGATPHTLTVHQPAAEIAFPNHAKSPSMAQSPWEWCRDWYQNDLPGGTDPEITTKAAFRVFRGGSWINVAGYCRSADRIRCEPDYRSVDLGFRLAAVQSSGK